MNDARPAPDQALLDIASYVGDYEIRNPRAYEIARLCVMDAIGCAIEALNFPECTRLLGPAVLGMRFNVGARVPGTQFDLDPVSGAFNITTMIRWLDFNDALAAMQGGHPSDSIGAVLAVADYLVRNRLPSAPRSMRDVLTAIVKCYEIQGILSMENRFQSIGFDYVLLQKVASAAVITQMLGGGCGEIVSAVSNAWADGVNLNVYRQGNNTGSRKSWAGGDAASRAVWLAFTAMKGEMAYPSVLTAKTYGFQDALLGGETLKCSRAYGDFAMENQVAFKFVPAGMQGQSAAQCAFQLHPLVKDRLDDIAAIEVKSHAHMMRVMNKTGPLSNPADRDHCVQYLVAVGLIHGHIGTQDFSDRFAADPRIDALREKMTAEEEPRYTRDFSDPQKRTNTHAVQVRFRDGTLSPKIEVEYPVGHPPLHEDTVPLLEAKFMRHVASRFSPERQTALLALFRDPARFERMPVDEFMAALTA